MVLALLLVLFPGWRWTAGAAPTRLRRVLLWAMGAGFASGSEPGAPAAVLRGLLSSEACLLALVLSLLQIASH